MKKIGILSIILTLCILCTAVLNFPLSIFSSDSSVGKEFVVDGMKYRVIEAGTINESGQLKGIYYLEVIANNYTGSSYEIPRFFIYNGVSCYVRQIGASAFQDCTALKSITIPDGIWVIGSNAFYNTGLTSVQLPWTVTELGRGAFCACEDLAQVTLGTGLKVIGRDAFGHAAITELAIPNSVITIERGAFNDCRSLKTVTFGNSVETIGYDAFASTALKSVILPKSVKSIAWHAFRTVTECYIEAGGAPIVEQDAFADGAKIYIPTEYGVSTSDRIWFGNNFEEPIAWRVVDEKTNTGEDGLLLYADSILSRSEDDPTLKDISYGGSSWQTSNLYAFCQDLERGFSVEERAALLSVSKRDDEYSHDTVHIDSSGEDWAIETTVRYTSNYAESELSEEKIFMLSAEEVAYYRTKGTFPTLFG